MRLDRTQVNQLKGLTNGASRDKSRPILTGVLLEWEVTEEGLMVTAVTTDSYILAVRRFLVRHPMGESFVEPKGLTLVDAEWLRKGLTMIRKATVRVDLELEDHGPALVTCSDPGARGSVATTVSHIEGRFPDYRSLVASYSDEGTQTVFSLDLIRKAMSTSGGVNHLTLMSPVGGLGARMWRSVEASDDILEGQGWWCLQMPVK